MMVALNTHDRMLRAPMMVALSIHDRMLRALKSVGVWGVGDKWGDFRILISSFQFRISPQTPPR
jgi:hypothetical protein